MHCKSRAQPPSCTGSGQRVGAKAGLWTLDWTHGLDCGLRFGLDFGLMRRAMTTISNNKLGWRQIECTKELLVCRGRADYFPWKIGEGCISSGHWASS